MIAHIEKHETHPIVDKIFDLDDAVEAFEYVEKSQQFGKVAFRISE